MKKKSIITFCLVIAAAVVLNIVSMFGLPGSMSAKYGGMLDGDTGIRQGIDLAGGSVISFQANADSPTEEEMNAVRSVYEMRLNGAGYTEARISTSEDGRVTIEIPSGTAASEDGSEINAAEQTQAAVELLSEVAKLTFRDYQGNVVLEGTDVESAQSLYGQPSQNANSQYYVQVTFTSEGARKFADATGAAASQSEPNNIIQIVMDEEVVSAPSVENRIDSTSCVITGNFDAESSARLANQINSGNLPFEMTKISEETVGAELGRDALPTSLTAAAIGILLVMVFMVIKYRLPGLIADLSLLIYVGLICLIMGVFRINLSLSGIAGIVLSIGMAVDADCIIFERIKEELKLGKTIRASVDAGFSKAFSAIIDSNITTIISCVVLYMSGIGTVTGFATTLAIGVILSMFTAIVITKFLMKAFVNLGVTNKALFYNVKKPESTKQFTFSKIKLRMLILPVIFVAAGVVMYFVHGGFNFDVEFLGGTRMQVEIGQEFDNDEIAALVEDTTGLEGVIQKSGATGQTAVIKLPAAEDEAATQSNQESVFAALQEKYSLSDEALLSVQTTSASFGAQVQQKALSYTLLAILCMLVYIIIRFDWRSAVMAVATLTLNVLVMAAVYTVTNIALNTTFIAAMLTVIGYCINNTIVIFDRVRENSKLRRGSETITAMADRSINETLGRTVSSTITTLITIVMIFILGVSTIRQFALPLIIGMIVGAYTSIFIAATYWAAWREKSAKAKAAAAAQKKNKK